MPRPFGYRHSEETKRKISLKHQGKKFSLESRKKMSVAKKGKPTWLTGTKGMGLAKANSGSFINGHKWPEEIEEKRLKNFKPLTGSKHPFWKGNKASYRSIHEWVQKYKGTPSLCVICGKTEGKFEWSNISYHYKRELDDWRRLCTSCHRKVDAQHRKGEI